MSVYTSAYGSVYAGTASGMPDPAFDSLIVAGQFELLGGSVPSADPRFPGAVFKLQPGYDTSAPLPVTEFLASLTRDGELPAGRRASNRTVTLPVNIHAPDFSTLAAATEALLQAIDAPQWQLTWTRAQGSDPAQYPLILDCFRAQQAAVQGGGLDEFNINPVNAVTLTFQALPYGRSDAPVAIPVLSPVPGDSPPPAPVILDTFATVSGTGFTRDTAHFVLGNASAKWSHTGNFEPKYTKTGLALDITGRTAFSVSVGIGADFPSTFTNPVLIQFTLTDSSSRVLKFGITRNLTPSSNASVPHWQLVSAGIPQGRTFNYANVAGYTLDVSNAPSPLFTGSGFGFNTWYNQPTASPPSVQAAPSVRGYVYSLPAITGTARAPLKITAQQAGATAKTTFTTPGPFQWPVPLNLTGGTVDVMCVGAGGAGMSQVAAGQGGGGGGGENAEETALPVTPGAVCTGVVGVAGTPQTSISTLAVTTAVLPSGVVGAAYSGDLQAAGGTPPYTWSFSSGSLPAGLALSSSAGLTGAFVSTDNYLSGQNATFEGGAGTWTGVTNGTVPASTAQARTGTGSMAMTSTASGTMSAGHCTTANITTQGMPCASGDVITCSAYFRAAVSTRNCQAGAEFYTSGGTSISTLLVAGGVTDTTTGWTLVTGTVTAPATTAYCRLKTQVNSTGGASEVHYVDDTILGTATHAFVNTRYDTLTGRTSQARRDYYGNGIYTTPVEQKFLDDHTAGRKICLTLRPAYNPVSSTERTSMDTFLAACIAAGLNMEICLWHEPFYEGLTSAQYIAMIQYYAATVRKYYPHVFVTANYTVSHNAENSYYAGDAYYDKVATDFYCHGYVLGDRLDAAASVADAGGKPFGLWEYNSSDDPVSGQTQDQATGYFNYIKAFFDGRLAAGKDNADLLHFNKSAQAITCTEIRSSADFRVPLIQGIYDDAQAIRATGQYELIYGSPAANGTTLLTAKVTDSLGATATADLQITIGATGALTVTTASLPNGAVGSAYSATLRAQGGTTPYTWQLTAGTMPSWETLNGSTGVLSGTPDAVITNRPLTFQVSDAAGATASVSLTQTVTSVSTSALPLFGVNNGDANPPASWQPIYDACFKPGQSFGYRDYGTAGVMPTAWNNGGVKADTQATFALFSWKPSIANILNGSLDTQINQWAKSCQAQWVKNPGSIYVSFWHEADHGSTTTAPTSSDVLKLHAYVYPRFKALAPSVPYGQIFTALAVTQNPTAWVSCPATVSGGRTLDFYGIDGYANTDRKASQVLTPAFNAIRSVAPTARVAVCENNCENTTDRAQWFRDAWQIALANNCLFFFPFFWNGPGPGGGNIAWHPDDSIAPGTVQAIKDIAAAAAPANSIAIGLDPPAVDGGDSSFVSDLGGINFVVAHGGKSALTSAGGAGGTGSGNAGHHNGGAGAAGASGAGGSGLGTPYTVCSAAVTSPATVTDVVTVTHAVAAKDAIVVLLTANSSAPSSVTDSKGNTYAQAVGNNVSGLDTYAYVSLNSTALTTSDTITVHWSFSGGTHSILARGCSGVLTSSALNVSVSATGTSTSPSTGSSGTLAQASEWVLMLTSTANGGGSPTAVTGGFTSVLIQHPGSGPYSAVSEQVTTATTAITGGETIVSATWCAAMVSFMAAPVSSGGYGGGGGAAASAVAAGAAGSTSSGGQAAASFGSGGDGSLVPDGLPSDGLSPGGGGGGASGTGGALQGGQGGNGKVVITRTTAVEQFSTLILHMASPDAPDNLSPLVTLGATSVIADGSAEYTVPSLVAGVNPDFAGTYTVVACADSFHASSLPRTMMVTVNQYETAGGRSYFTTASRTFTPDDDITNGIVVIGEVTLPVKDVAADNTAAVYTVQVLDTDLQDLWLDVMLLDTQGETIILSDPRANANVIYYVDEPDTNRDIGRIMATNTDRTAAYSVLDRCERVSGGPLTVYPGSNLLVAYSAEGAPQLRLEYLPRWYSARTG